MDGHMIKNRTKGFTLVEVSASVALLVVAMAMAISGYMFALKNVNQGDAQNELDIDVQLAMESLKKDLRLSSLHKMFYYPNGPGPYQAISFPKAYDSDGDGLIEKEIIDGEERIVWDETVIYHIFPGDPDKLIKTVFNPRDNSLSDPHRQQQLEDVVADGHGGNTYNGQNATSHVLFSNLVEWEINPKGGRYDAYSPIMTRDRSSLGFILLGPGSHDISFRTVGKNANSSGYHIGIDQLFMSGSASPREGEAQLPVKAQAGAKATEQYMPVGSWKGNHHLYFPATAENHSFTITLDNDRWEETNFNGLGYNAEDTRVDFDLNLTPSDFVVRLNGMDKSWETASQTGDLEGDSPTGGNLRKMAVRILQKGSEIADNGSWFTYNGLQCKVSFTASDTEAFKLTDVCIGESVSPSNTVMEYLGTAAAPVRKITFNGVNGAEIPAGQTATSDWIDLPIDRSKNYLVSFRIDDSETKDGPKQWFDYYATDPANPTPLTTMVLENAAAGIADDLSWSALGPYMTNRVFGLESIEVNYPETGTYTSHIFDTHVAAPIWGDITWNADMPAGTALAFKVRTGDNPDLSDAPDWNSLAAFFTPRAVAAPYKRYIQFQSLMKSDSSGHLTPRLKDVTIDWTGERKLVDISGIFTKGPSYGKFEVEVNNEPLRSALIIDLEIYKDIVTTKSKKRRISSSLKVEITPRNTKL